eukprot:1195289-Prorocentrum_minimum.AAC.9
MITFVDLCCGIGSFHRAMQQVHNSKSRCVCACDINPVVRDTYAKLYPGTPILGDVAELLKRDLGKLDLLCAGFPCQSFSAIGLHKGDLTVFDKIVRVIRRASPKIVVLENVPGLLSIDDGRTYAVIKRKLERSGYAVNHALINCKNYGVPQSRRRVFIVGLRSDAFRSPSAETLVDEIVKGVYARGRSTCVSLTKYLGHHTFVSPVSKTIRVGGRFTRLGDRHSWSEYAVKPKKKGDPVTYTLTLADCLRLQGFSRTTPLTGSLTQRFQMLGNTIPTNMAHAVLSTIRTVLKLN